MAMRTTQVSPQPFNDKGPNYSDYLGIGTLRGEFERGEIVLKALYGNREGGQYNQVAEFRVWR